MPITHCRKVGQNWVVVATSMNQSELTILVQSFKSYQGRMKSEMIINSPHLISRDSNLWPLAVIGVVAIRHHRIKSVISSIEFYYD